MQAFLLSGLLLLVPLFHFVGIVTSSTKVARKAGTLILFFRFHIFCDSGTFAEEVIPVLRRKNRASLATCNFEFNFNTDSIAF